MHHGITFIETSIFTRQITEIADDDELRELQKQLIESPERGRDPQHRRAAEDTDGDRLSGEKWRRQSDLPARH